MIVCMMLTGYNEIEDNSKAKQLTWYNKFNIKEIISRIINYSMSWNNF